MFFPNEKGGFLEFSDEQLLKMVQDGSALPVSVLVARHSVIVRAKAARYNGAGVDSDDLAQEGMLGLLSAIYSFNPELGVPFTAYASICVSNSISSYLKSSARLKHLPLNDFRELDSNIIDFSQSPEDLVIDRDELEGLKKLIFSQLSGREKSVITLYLAGCSYDEIAENLDTSVKSVDNALQRVRRKLRKSVINYPD